MTAKAGYYTSASGQDITFSHIAEQIRRLHPHLIGAHIFKQLDALGLRDGFDRGHTPIALPYSFTD